jgi:hypothetical protein
VVFRPFCGISLAVASSLPTLYFIVIDKAGFLNGIVLRASGRPIRRMHTIM